MIRRMVPGVFAVLIYLGGCDQASDSATADSSVGETNTTAEQVKKEVAEASSTAAEYVNQKRQEYMDKMNAQLTELDTKIEQLRERAGQKADQAKENLQEVLDDLERKRQVVAEKVQEIQAKAPDAWNDLRQGLNEAVDELEQAYQDAAARFQ